VKDLSVNSHRRNIFKFQFKTKFFAIKFARLKYSLQYLVHFISAISLQNTKDPVEPSLVNCNHLLTNPLSNTAIGWCVIWATIVMVMLWSSSVVKANWAQCGRTWMLSVTGSPVKAAAQTVVETVARNLKGGWTDNHNIQKVFIRKILRFLATREICTIWWFANRELHLSVDFCFWDWVILNIAIWESLNITGLSAVLKFLKFLKF